MQFAAGDTTGEAEIIVPIGARPGGANLVYDYSSQEVNSRTTLKVDRLDVRVKASLFGRHTILKTDCQGFDARVLMGASGLLDRISVILAESIIDVPAPHPNLSHMLPFLRDYGFKLFAFGDFLAGSSGIPTQVDCVFVRTEEFRNWL